VTFRARILLALGAVALVPVAVLGWLSDGANRDELLEGAGRAQARAAGELAQGCEQYVLDRAQGLHVSASFIPFERLSPADLRAVLAIPYRQFPDLTILAAVDGEGAPLADALAGGAGQGGREPVTQQDLDLFSRRLPLEAARASQLAVGPPYRAASGAPRVPLAARAGDGAALVAELSLGELSRRARALAGADGFALLLDAGGEPFAGGDGAPLGDEERALVAEGRAARGGATRVVRRAGAPWLASYAAVGTLGWGVLLEQPGGAAFSAADRVRRYTAFWGATAAVLTLFLGIFLARSLTRPVAALSSAAQALTEGRLDARVDVSGGDELAQLGTAFNHMAGEVARRDEEIRRWNAELQQRVADKSAELRRAEEQVARSRQLAAIGSLAAGVAHGLNNPMTSVVGLMALAREEAGPASAAGELLGSALVEAKRVTRVVEELRRLAAEERGEGERRFSPAAAVRAALEARREALAAQGIAVDAELDAAAPPVQGDPRQIGELVEHLVENAAAAMPTGGRLGVAVTPVGGDAVRLTVSDTGGGIPAAIRDRIFDPFFTTSARPGAGLGLTRSHAIVDAHHGAIHVESEEGRGTRFTVVLPAAAREVHLS
jgi:signal transduction histidine kinase